MQFFFCGFLVAAITYFLKLGHNNHGLIFTVVTLGRRNSGPSTGRRNSGPSTVNRNNGPSTGRIINGPYMGRIIDWLNMGQTDRIMAVNGLELESFIHGPTITSHH